MTFKLSLDFHRLDRLSLHFRGGLTGLSSGKRPTNKYGSSLEFADYRPYLPGDDLRRIDWPLYGRSRRLYTRLNRSEVDATVNFLVDGSASMDWGEPHKGRRALELVLALGYISLQAYDRVAVAVGAREPARTLPPVYGKGSFSRLLRFLEEQDFGREGDLNDFLPASLPALRPRQMTVLLSDFLSPRGYAAGLRRLLAARQEVLIFHLVSPDELEPEFRGSLSLVDVETGRKKVVEIDPYLLQRYREGVRRYSEEIREFCRLRDIGYFLFDTRWDPVEFLLGASSRLMEVGSW